MSSASSGRYQSRLFNFVHKQSRWLTEQCDRAFRHLQVATSQIAPVVLYPLYLLFKSNRSVGKMHQSVQQSWRKLQADDNDFQPQTSSPNADTPIQRVLLLVDALPSEEAVSTPTPDKKPRNFLSFLASWRFKFFLNARIRGMKGPVALLDCTVADLESKHVAPVSKVAITLGKRTWEIVHWAQTQLTISLSGKFQPGSNSQASAPDASSEAHTFRIQALIWAAIDYFFGHRGGNPAITTTPRAELELPAALKSQGKPLPHRRGTSVLGTTQPSFAKFRSANVDPWLTLSDLFGEPDSEGEPAILPQPESSTFQAMNQLSKKTNPALPSSQSARYPLRNQNTQLAPAPDWIETHATAMGYVKHPLEQLLEWLDHAMLWLEELLMKVFQWVRSSAAR